MMRNLTGSRQGGSGRRIALIRHWPDTVIAWIVTAIGTVSSGATLQDNYNDHWHRPVELFFTLFFWALAWLVWNVLAMSRIAVWDAGVEVVNGYVRYWLPWSTVAVSESTVDVVIHLKDGSRIRPLSLLASPASGLIFGGRHQRETAAALEAARIDKSNGGSETRIRRFEPRLISLIAISGVVAFLAFVVP
jgi:hypothetical protein